MADMAQIDPSTTKMAGSDAVLNMKTIIFMNMVTTLWSAYKEKQHFQQRSHYGKNQEE
jgi:hypothetical protein